MVEQHFLVVLSPPFLRLLVVRMKAMASFELDVFWLEVCLPHISPVSAILPGAYRQLAFWQAFKSCVL